MSAYTEYPKYRAAADLAAQGQFVGPAIPIRGATAVAFHMYSSGTNTPAGVNIEVRRSGKGWVATLGATVLGVMAAVPGTHLGVSGAVACLLPDSNDFPGLRTIPAWDECRLIISGHATLVIAALAVEAQVVFDNVASQNVADGKITS